MSDGIILVGCGNMGFAMLKGWLDKEVLKPQEIHVVEPNETLRERAGKLGVNTVADVDALGSQLHPRMILVAVKPQMMADILPAYQRFSPNATFVSIAAGIPTAVFEQYLGSDTPVIRCMPNTPAAIGKGMLVTYQNAKVTQDNAAFVTELLKTSGQVASVADEGLIDAVTAVSGSGPAYVFHFIECLTEAGISVGLQRETAALLAMQTVYGAGALAAQSSDSPAVLRQQVTSPNGTTAAALDVLMGADRLKTMMKQAVDAAHKRSIELGRS